MLDLKKRKNGDVARYSIQASKSLAVVAVETGTLIFVVTNSIALVIAILFSLNIIHLHDYLKNSVKALQVYKS